MPDVTAEIKKILKLRDQLTISGEKALIEILKDLQKQVIQELGSAYLTNWDAYHLKKYLSAIEDAIGQFERLAKAEISSQLDAAWKTGVGLVDSPLARMGIYSGLHLSTSVLDTLKDFAFHRIANLSGDAWLKIKGELTMGVLGGKTPQQVANSIGMNLTEESIFKNIADRAETITKTEMGRVFSQGTQSRMDQAAEYVPGLEKQWVHAGHPKKARPTHVAAHGEHVPVNKPFNIGGVQMMFPRAPGAPLEEVINCG